MSVYAIGDVQGCYDELEALLRLIQFDEQKDVLWFAGDLVARGPKSLETLRFVRMLNLKGKAITVLGNHEIHLLARYYLPELAQKHPEKSDLLTVLNAPDAPLLCEWLREQPFFHWDEALGYVMTHAGIFPGWTLLKAQSYAQELEKQLQTGDPKLFFQKIYGDFPDQWNEQLTRWERLRFIANVFTRMRFCTQTGRLDFEFNQKMGSQPETLIPWFKLPHCFERQIKLLFGHWAALEGETGCPDVFALDGGCVWGKALIAMRLEDQQVFKAACSHVQNKPEK